MCGFDLIGLATCPQLFRFCLWLLLLGKARSCLIFWLIFVEEVEEEEEYLDIPQCSQWKAKLTWGVVASSSGSTFPHETDDACFVKYVLSGRCRSTQAGAKDVVWRVDSPSMAGRIAWIARIGPQPHSNPPYCVFWPIWTMSKNEEHFLLDIAIAQKSQQLVLLILGNKPNNCKMFLTYFLVVIVIPHSVGAKPTNKYSVYAVRSAIYQIVIIIFKIIWHNLIIWWCWSSSTLQQRMKSVVCIIICWMATANQPGGETLTCR